MKYLKVIFIFLSVCLNIFGFKLDGITFNKSLNSGYKELTIYNETTKKTRYKVEIEPSGDEDITDCIQVTPKIVTIEPKSSQTLKLYGIGKRKLEEKEYSFVVKFNQIIIPTLTRGQNGVTSGTSTVGIAPSIQMKGYGGEIDYSKALELKDIKFEKDEKGDLIFRGTLVNNSHGATELGVNFFNRDRSNLVSKGLGGIEAKSTIKLEIPVTRFTNEKQIKYIEFFDDNIKVIKQIVLE